MSESTSQAAAGDEAEYSEEYLGVPGVRFAPTDRDLIVHYLRRKLRGEPLPTGTDLAIDCRDAYAEHPKKLVPKLGDGSNGAWYLFSPRDRTYAGGMRPKRDTGDGEGHWKAVGAKEEVLGGADSKEVIGAKRGLTFHEHLNQVDALGKRKRVKNTAKPTKWKMVEFVSSNSSRAARDDTVPDPMLLNDYVLCKISKRSLRRAAERGPAQGEDEDDDDNGEEPAPDGGGESQEKHLPGQQLASGGAGSNGNQQQPTADAPSGGHMAAPALPVDDYRSAQAQPASGGGAGSSPDEQPQPTPEAPNRGGAAPTAATVDCEAQSSSEMESSAFE